MSENGHKPWLTGPGVHPGDAEPDDTQKLVKAIEDEWLRALFPPEQMGERISDWSLDYLVDAVNRGGPDDEDYWGSEQAAA